MSLTTVVFQLTEEISVVNVNLITCGITCQITVSKVSFNCTISGVWHCDADWQSAISMCDIVLWNSSIYYGDEMVNVYVT